MVRELNHSKNDKFEKRRMLSKKNSLYHSHECILKEIAQE